LLSSCAFGSASGRKGAGRTLFFRRGPSQLVWDYLSAAWSYAGIRSSTSDGFFTVNVAIAADHQLVDTGPYRFVRHPSYTGALLAFVGFAMVLRNWASVLVISLPIAFAFLYRISVEELALVQALGERYRAYIKRTKRLLPFVY
jgi:protein-S-isoprenylcysteine O-methyltransferase Ste14